jgi:hypothetical protein
MSDPIAFASSTPSLGLPLLVAGQAQKEFFVNQALSLLDAMHVRSVNSSRPTPPSSADEGECFLVSAFAAGVWTAREDQIAVRIGGDWHFIEPTEGMQLFDRDKGRILVFRSQWMPAIAPALPTGGTVIDTEARASLSALIQALLAIGVLGSPAP